MNFIIDNISCSFAHFGSHGHMATRPYYHVDTVLVYFHRENQNGSSEHIRHIG
jgi:hypothetical protein